MDDNKILTDEQYNTLQEGSIHFHEIEKMGVTRSVQPGFLGKLQRIYSEFYNSPLNVNCQQCLTNAFSKLSYHLGVKRALIEQEKLKNEEKLKADNPKRRG